MSRTWWDDPDRVALEEFPDEQLNRHELVVLGDTRRRQPRPAGWVGLWDPDVHGDPSWTP